LYATDANFRVFTLEHKFLDIISEAYGKAFEKCWGHPLYPAIAADGGVYPCCLMIGNANLCFGNINDHSFSDIWKDPTRMKAVASIDAHKCPINCKLSETNKTLEIVHRAAELPLRDYLN
jgi:radical SAM protein with 4Fe4S-binding SPASM domain